MSTISLGSRLLSGVFLVLTMGFAVISYLVLSAPDTAALWTGFGLLAVSVLCSTVVAKVDLVPRNAAKMSTTVPRGSLTLGSLAGFWAVLGAAFSLVWALNAAGMAKLFAVGGFIAAFGLYRYYHRRVGRYL